MDTILSEIVLEFPNFLFALIVAVFAYKMIALYTKQTDKIINWCLFGRDCEDENSDN